MGNEQGFNHFISDEVAKGVEDGLKRAKEISERLFGAKHRTRDVYVIYEFLMGSIHCDHNVEEEKEKEPWE